MLLNWFVANVRLTGEDPKGKSALQRQLSFCVGVGVGVLASISQSLRRAAFDSCTSISTRAVLNVSLYDFNILLSNLTKTKTTSHCATHPL